MLIGVSGKARSGKGVFAQVAKEEYGARIISFATGVKEECASFLNRVGVPWRPENLYGENLHREEMFPINDLMYEDIPCFQTILPMSVENGDKRYISFRTLLQWWGTEYRRSQDINYWVKRALAKCKNDSSSKLFVFDDLRFENEAEILMVNDACLVRIERPNNPHTVSNSDHPSEISLDDWVAWHYIIENEGSDFDLYQTQCRLVLNEIVHNFPIELTAEGKPYEDNF